MSILQLGKVLAKPLLKKVFKSQGAKVGGYVIGGATAIFGGTVGYQAISENNEDKQNHELHQKKQRIWEDQDINLLDRTWFTLRKLKEAILGGGISDKISYSADKNELINVGREYFKSIIGDTSGMSDSEKIKAYKKAAREFYLQLTDLGLDETEARNQIEEVLAASIGELRAGDRAKAVKHFVDLGTSDKNVNNRAKIAQQCALFNLTNKDAFDKFPDQQQAVEYQFQTFSHMRDIDVQEAFNNLNQVKDIYKKLREKNFDINCLSEQEKSLLQGIQDFDAIKQNYLTGGYAGAYAGIPANGYLLDCDGNPNTDFVQGLLSQIYNAAEDLGITNEVFGALNTFMNSHKEVLQQIEKLHGENGFKDLMDSATGGQYSEYLRTGSVTGGGGDIEGSGGTAYKALGDRTGNPARSTVGVDNNITVTDPGAASRLSENSDADGDEPLAQKHLNQENAPVTNPNRTAYNVENVFAKYAQLSGSNINKNIERAVNIGSVPLIKKTISEAGLSPQAAFMALAATQSKDKKVLALAIEYFNQMDSKIKSASFVQVSETWQLNLFQIMSVSEVMSVNLDDCELPPDQLTLLKEMQQKKVEENHMEGLYKERLQR